MKKPLFSCNCETIMTTFVGFVNSHLSAFMSVNKNFIRKLQTVLFPHFSVFGPYGLINTELLLAGGRGVGAKHGFQTLCQILFNNDISIYSC